MHRYRMSAVAALAVVSGFAVMEGGARAQYPPAAPPGPVVTLGAPLPADTPPVPFLGARYTLRTSQTCPSFSYYAPGYNAPMFYNPRYPDAGPYYYTRSYPYTPSYYGYYYTPGYFRY